MNSIPNFVLKSLPYDVFTDKDISFMDLTSPDSRYGIVKRAIKNDEIIHLKRGLYCLSKKNQRGPLSTYVISQILYGPSYVSMESALSHHGWIPEGVFTTTCVSMMRFKAYKTPIGDFSYHPVPQKKFYESVQRLEDAGCGGYFMADPLKALCDYLYVHNKTWSGIGPLVKSLRIEETSLFELTAEQCERLDDNYRSRRVRTFIKGVRKDLSL